MLDLRIAATSAVPRPERVRKASYTVSESAGRERRRAYGWLTAAGVATFMVSAMIARSGRVGGAEAWVFRAINDLPGALFPIANVAQQAGNLAAAFVVAGVALALRRWRLAACVLVASVSKLGVERLIKLVVVRERPGTTVPGAILRGNVPVAGESFVSGHAITVTMLAVILFFVLPRWWRMVPPVLVLGVVVARIYVAAHNPIDVVGGVSVGLVMGGVCSLLIDPLGDRKLVPSDLTAPAVESEPTSPGWNGRGRHASDLVRVFLAGVVIAVTAAVASTHKVSRLEEDVFRLINRLPDLLRTPLDYIMQGGALAAVPVVAIGALAFRKVRLSRDVAIAGASAWVLAKVLKSIVARQRPFAALDAVFRHVTETGLGYPSGHAAVAAAIAAAAAPYLNRQLRRATWMAVVVIGIARIYVGAHLPLDVIGGWALGVLLGSVVHLAFGAPNGGPNAHRVRVAIESIVGPVERLRPLVTDARGSTPYVASTSDATVFAKVVTTQNRDADVLFKLTRWILFRHLEDEAPFNSPQQIVEHEAYATLMAERAGVRVEHLRASVRFAGSSVLVSDLVNGARSLEALAEKTDVGAVLVDAWQQIALLHQARIAHRDLRSANVVVGDDGLARLIDFGFAEVTASDRQLAMDVAEFLTATSIQFGSDIALDAAAAGIGSEALVSALPFIQPLALSASTRSKLRFEHGTLRAIREAVEGRTGVEAPPLEPLTRVKPITIVMVLALGFGIHLLLPRVGELDATIRSLRTAELPWLAGALAASAATYAFAAVAVMGASPIPLPFGRTVVAESASSVANRFVPLGGIGVMVRYLQRHGLDATAAGTTIATADLGSFTVHVPLLVLAGIVTGTSGITGVHLPSGAHLLIIAIAILTVVGIVVATPARRRIGVIVTAAFRQLGDVVHDPRRVVELWIGSLGVTTCYIASFACSLAAFSAHVPLSQVAFVYLAGTAVAAAAPTPGGLGAVEAALVVGLTATGVAPAPAIAGVLTFRLATFWLPILPGSVAFRTLRHREEL